jgi:6-methylsalicylate decarboxylase
MHDTSDTQDANLSRRSFLAALSALGAGALLPGCQTTPEAATGRPQRIDIHHHFAPPGYSKELKALKQGHAKWSVEGTLDEMEKSGIQTAFTSLINPGMQAWMGDVEGSRKIARISNEYAAQLMRDYPGRFGSFAPSRSRTSTRACARSNTRTTRSSSTASIYGRATRGGSSAIPPFSRFSRS